ncbi:hypothetical protein [Archangium sp.]|jgi:hypothetical protein|uniref:hypothetical protein n=1 Tax=Archangium sp. TaxID=1872627 RepID=UPI002ED9B5AD
MKTLLAVLQLTLVPQVPVPGSEPKVSTPQTESKPGVVVFDFEEDAPLDVTPPTASEWECFPDRRTGRYALLRIRENFDDKVMQSVQEL